MNILLVGPPDQFLLDLQVVLIRTYSCRFILKQSADDALNELISGTDIALIITDKKIGTEKSYEILIHALQSLDLKVPMIYRDPNKAIGSEFVLNEHSLEESAAMVGIVLKERITQKYKNNLSFVPVKIEQFLNIEITSLSCDVYIKIKRSGLPDQYVKRLHANHTFSVEEIEKYISSGLTDFYIPKSQYSDFINMISIEIIKSLKNTKFKDLDNFLLNSFAFETMIERLKFFGAIDDITVHLANEAIVKMTKSVEKNEALTVYLKHLKNKSSSFAFFHSYLIAILSEKLSKFYDWNSPKARDKLLFLAYFHDISLYDLSFTEIHSNSELETSSLSDSDKDLIKHHAAKSAEMLDHFKEIPFGLSQLVREHHGSKVGIGFQDALSVSISPMAIMFIVLEDFAHLFVKNNVESLKDLEILFTTLEDTYNKQAYTQTLAGLRSVFFPKT